MTKNRPIHLAFIDLKKVYDSISRQKPGQLIEQIVITDNLIQAMKTLYRHNKVIIKIGNKFGEIFKTTKGLPQGCSTSPTLFKTFVEHTLRP